MGSLNRHEQLLRIFHVIDIFMGRRHELTTEELKRHLGDRGVVDDVSEKSLQRDIEFLERFGYRVFRTKKTTERGSRRNAWRVEPPANGQSRPAAPPSVSLPELLSLMAARDLFAPLAGTIYWRGISQVLAKLEAVATPQLIEHANSLTHGLVVHPKQPGFKYSSRLLNGVHRAIRNRLQLTIRYQRAADDEPKTSTVLPESLVLYGGSLYLAAYRHASASAEQPSEDGLEDDAVRFFKLDRLLEATPLARTFDRRSPPVDQLLANSITIFRSSDPPRRYRIRMARERARWACEKPFHPQQQVLHDADGSIVLEIPHAWDDEMIPQLLSLGDKAEVLEPRDVRQRLAEAGKAIAALYEG